MYKTKLNITDTQYAIAKLKKDFSKELSKKLRLVRVSAPLFLTTESGLNDGLNGETPVLFKAKNIDSNLEIVHSLAKWKREALHKYNIALHHGIYTDMNAIRREEDLDATHSFYVDQWDWERNIEYSDRNVDTLKQTVKLLFEALKNTEDKINDKYSELSKKLPDELFFITSDELYNLYPNIPAEQREYEIVKKHKAVFIIGIGNNLPDNKPHSKRAKDYDDWSLNGDMIVYHPTLDIALEISSMGIRVDSKALMKQYAMEKSDIEKISPYHHAIVNDLLPYTIGGGLGQSRIAMFLLEKAHIGEVQVSYWSDTEKDKCKKENIVLL
ncbi:aspartate--ammonia ligase [Mycoplasma phocoenae]|uniref:Aspartate--ammonia ligase n=1 Tax=Mycoplasma phocoenae TaxID=754517 RepID=A0A858U0Y1_9MOLU|nr:aspartate--ammonia ligase [Mycoplasma phocoenae]QJG66744.1 aspartate--ammonia ligase [Mycoplasma phocoenae]